jgi:hypothetical protein
MHRILFLPDIRPAGYQANPKAGYRITGRIFVLTNIFLVVYKIIFVKKSFNNYVPV